MTKPREKKIISYWQNYDQDMACRLARRSLRENKSLTATPFLSCSVLIRKDDHENLTNDTPTTSPNQKREKLTIVSSLQSRSKSLRWLICKFN